MVFHHIRARSMIIIEVSSLLLNHWRLRAILTKYRNHMQCVIPSDMKKCSCLLWALLLVRNTAQTCSGFVSSNSNFLQDCSDLREMVFGDSHIFLLLGEEELQ